MYSKIKKTIGVLLAVCFVLSVSVSAVGAAPSKLVKINGQFVEETCDQCLHDHVYCLECEENGNHFGHWKHTLWISLDKQFNFAKSLTSNLLITNIIRKTETEMIGLTNLETMTTMTTMTTMITMEIQEPTLNQIQTQNRFQPRNQFSTINN
jgi:hypothetical protein